MGDTSKTKQKLQKSYSGQNISRTILTQVHEKINIYNYYYMYWTYPSVSESRI